MGCRSIAVGLVALIGVGAVGLQHGASPAGAAVVPPPRTIALPSAQTSFRFGPGAYGDPVTTPDGRYVLYQTRDGDIASDTNGEIDVYLYDSVAKTTELVSVGPNGELGNAQSARASMSSDARYVVFNSLAADFGGGDGNDHLYLRDRVAHTTTRVDADYVDGSYLGNGDNPTISADGSTIAYTASLGQDGVVVREWRDGTGATIASRNWLLPDFGGYVDAGSPQLDADGGRLFFVSPSSSIAAGDEPDTSADVFMWTGGQSATLVTPGPADVFGPISVSADGTRIGFVSSTQIASSDDNFGFDVYVRDLSTGSYQLASRGVDGAASGISYSGYLSANGRYVSFLDQHPGTTPDKTTSTQDAFVRDLSAGTLSRRSVPFDAPGEADGTVLNVSAPSNDGRYLAFSADARNLAPNTPPDGANLFVNDRDGVVDQAPNAAFHATVSTGATPTSVAFTNTSSDSDGRVAKNVWNFGDGKTSKAKNVKHSYTNCSSSPTSYLVTLTVTDNRGSTRTVSHHVEVAGTADGPARPAVAKTAGKKLAWSLRNALAPCAGGDTKFSFGNAGDIPLMGDWDGDGGATIGVFRNGTFLLRNTNSPGAADLTVHFGAAGDTPVVGDWDGDGTDTVGVVTPSGEWQLRNSNTDGPADLDFTYGTPGATPVVGDWNGDDVDTPGMVTSVGSALHWQLRDTASAGADDYTFDLGAAGDKPIVGDWNHRGAASPGFVQGTVWNLRDSVASGAADHTFKYGTPTAHPVVWHGGGGVIIGD